MKYLVIAALVSFNLTTQAQYKAQLTKPEKNDIENKIQHRFSINEAADTADIIWYEDFANGLNGNNSSTDPTWTTGGDDGEIWIKDYNGSNGQYAGSTPYTLDSESASNGWMIFDGDSSNLGVPQSNFADRMGTLTSPYIDLSNDSNVTLSFQHAYRWCCFFAHELIVSINNGSGWENDTSFVLNTFVSVNELAPTSLVEIIISDVAALKDSVRIRFDWGNNEETASHYFWMIDDVKIIKTKPYSSNILSSFNILPSEIGSTSYRVMPIEQISNTSYQFGGMFNNTGYNTLDSMRVYAEIDSAIYNSQSNGYSVLSSDTDTLYVNDGFTPEDTGTYICNIFGIDDNNNTATDTLRQRFEVSEFIYARDNGNNANTFGINAINDEGTYQIGNVFNIYETATIHSVKLRLDSRTGSNASGKIYINKIDPIANNANFQQGVEFLTEFPIPNLGDHTGDWVDFIIPPFQANAGDILLVTLYAKYTGMADDTVFISTSGLNPFPGESRLQDIDGVSENSAPLRWFYTGTSPCLRLNFDPNVQGINVSIEENDKNYVLQVFPNPNNGSFRVQFNSKQSANSQLSIKDVIGRTIFSEKINSVGIYSKDYNFSHLKKGLYFINLKQGDESEVSQSIIVK